MREGESITGHSFHCRICEVVHSAAEKVCLIICGCRRAIPLYGKIHVVSAPSPEAVTLALAHQRQIQTSKAILAAWAPRKVHSSHMNMETKWGQRRRGNGSWGQRMWGRWRGGERGGGRRKEGRYRSGDYSRGYLRGGNKGNSDGVATSDAWGDGEIRKL